MIRYDLRCDKEHVFEAWFANSSAYDEQAASGALSCPICDSKTVSKAIMAPNIARKGSTERKHARKIAHGQAEMRRFLRKVREHVEQNADHVGTQFPEEARKIHYGERPPANIYGDATPEEVQELREEGVDIAAIPWIDREN
ncbi:MAG: DUF1178 family protein [Pseudomonadota bacterium]